MIRTQLQALSTLPHLTFVVRTPSGGDFATESADVTSSEQAASMFDALTREQLVEWILAAALVVVGLSLLLRSRTWIEAFSSAATHPLAPLVTGLYALLSGLFIVSLHNVWTSDARVIVTLIGWVALAGGVLFLLIPETYRALLRRVPITPQLVALRGLLRIALGGTIVGYLLSQG